jgi:hypothetical protein
MRVRRPCPEKWLCWFMGVNRLRMMLGRGINRLVEAFDVAIFIGMYEVEGGGADEFVRLVTCVE